MPQRTAHLSVSPNSAVVFGITARSPQSQKCTSKSESSPCPWADPCTWSRRQPRAGLAASPRNTYVPLRVVGVITVCVIYHISLVPVPPAGICIRWAPVLGAEAFKKSRKDLGTNQCQAYNGLWGWSCWAPISFLCPKSKGPQPQMLSVLGRVMLNSVVLRVSMLQSINKRTVQN